MALVTLEEAKAYLRVDSSDEDSLVESIIQTAENLCADVARLSQEQRDAIDSGKNWAEYYTASGLASVREVLKVSILYTVGYLFEHREEADHHGLVLTLRSLLFSIREGVV